MHTGNEFVKLQEKITKKKRELRHNEIGQATHLIFFPFHTCQEL